MQGCGGAQGRSFEGYSWIWINHSWVFTHFITQTHPSAPVLHLCPGFPPCALNPYAPQMGHCDTSVSAQHTQILTSRVKAIRAVSCTLVVSCSWYLVAHPAFFLSNRSNHICSVLSVFRKVDSSTRRSIRFIDLMGLLNRRRTSSLVLRK